MTQLQSEDSNKQFMHFGLTGAVVDTLSWAFFSILIYKEVGGIESILLSTLLMYLGIYTSFTIMSFLVDRLGYLQAYRFSMIFHCIVAAIFAISLPNLAGIYLIMSFLRGLSSGTYWPIRHSYVLKDIHKEERSSAINTLQSSVIFIEAILPILAGALISYTGNYYATFSLASIIYLLSAFYPFKFNSKSVSKISSTEITRILKQPNIWRFLLLKFFHSTIETIIVTLISIIPFIFIKSEFGVGALASAVGITVALFSFAERKKSNDLHFKIAKISWIGYSIINVIFVIFWTAPLLIIRSLYSPFASAFGTSSLIDMDARLREKFLGKYMNESALEMNMIIETIFVLARVFIVSIIYILIADINANTDILLRIIFGLASGLMVFCYYLYRKLDTFVE